MVITSQSPMRALTGARGLLRSAHPPLVFLELHGTMLHAAGASPRAPLEQLTAAGYTLHGLGGEALDLDVAAAEPLVRLVARPAGVG